MKNLVLLHDLINSSLSSHQNNDCPPFSEGELIAVLRFMHKLLAMIYCERFESRNIFDHLRKLNITNHYRPYKTHSNKNRAIGDIIKAQNKKQHQ